MHSQVAGSPHISRSFSGWRSLPGSLLTRLLLLAPLFLLALLAASPALAQDGAMHEGGKANLVVPIPRRPVAAITFGTNGHTLLFAGVIVAILGLVFGLVISKQIKNHPVHQSMLEVKRADLRDVQDLPDHAGQIHR